MPTATATVSSPLLDQLTDVVGPDGVLTDPAELFVYECDGFTIARARPAAVVFPTDTEQVSAVVKILAAAKVQIVPRGSGTGLAGGCVALEDGVIVSTTRMNRILSIDLPNRVAQVQAGVRNTQLTDAVAALPGGKAYHFAPDPSSQRASTIGGNAATNAGGIHTLKDFVSSNHVIGVEMVLADGAILKAGGNDGRHDTGPFDLPGLICGSEGTLGIITSLWVRLAPKAISFRTMVATFANTADACRAVSEVIAAGMLPAALEMMDGSMIQAVEAAFHLGYGGAQALVLIEIDGIDDLLDAQLEQLVAICRSHHAERVDHSSDPARRAALWKARKSAFGALGRLSHSYCTQDACVPRSKLAQVLQRIEEIGAEYGLRIPSAFHAGDGNVHPIFLYDDKNPDEVRKTLEAAEQVLKYCVDVGGTVTGEHGVGVEKLHLMPYLFDAATMATFQVIKDVFDPAGQINAGKLIPSGRIHFDLFKPGRKVPQ